MGLPLFVAPVQSDLSSKAPAETSNHGSTSPTRMGIRRHHRPDSRERRAAMRRQMSIRDRLSSGSLRQHLPASRRDDHPPAWSDLLSNIESELTPPAPSEGAQSGTILRQVLMDATRNGGDRRAQLEDQINVIFGGRPNNREEPGSRLGDDDNQDTDLGWWTFDTRPRYTRARIINTGGPLQDRSEDRPRSRQRISPLVQQVTVPNSSTETENRRQRLDSRVRIPTSSSSSISERSRRTVLRRARGVDGLGDRDRSVSPEVWDTLLSTLTPDPQPPSAGSSFASTVASQSAGASTGTSMTTPVATETAPAVDQACESGCEDNSDGENPDAVSSSIARSRRMQEERRGLRMRIPSYNLDGPGDLGYGGRMVLHRPGARPPRRHQTDGPTHLSEAWELNIQPPSEDGSRPARQPSPLLPFAGEWVGHLSVGNSDDEQTSDTPALNRESSAASGNNTSTGEEEWVGMQHIVRSLARREDIPDEWWAEAGLSRMLPQGGTD